MSVEKRIGSCLHSARSKWKGFSHGGTLKALVQYLKRYIWDGEKLPAGSLGPWPHYGDEGLWGYGEDMMAIMELAEGLGMI